MYWASVFRGKTPTWRSKRKNVENEMGSGIYNQEPEKKEKMKFKTSSHMTQT